MRQKLPIESVFGGFMPSKNYGSAGEFLLSLGIDPDMPMTDDSGDVRSSGLIRPVKYAKFSGDEVDAPPIKILTTPKDSYIWVILSSGKVVRYDSDYSNETDFGNVQESSMDVPARGAWYYNNGIYIATPHNISRVFPLDGSPTIEDEVWTGSELGSQPALTDTQYPESLFNIGYINHFGFAHSDGACYFLDYKDGKGFIHKIQTKKTTVQGDTDDGSAYQSVGDLSLPFDFIPVTAVSAGTDIVISGTKTTDTGLNQGDAELFFWNAADELFYRRVPISDAICTVLSYQNGTLNGLSGSLNGGYRLWRYVGGDAIDALKIIEDGLPPLQSSFANVGDRFVWGANSTYPIVTSGLYAHGSKSGLFPNGLHHIALGGFDI